MTDEKIPKKVNARPDNHKDRTCTFNDMVLKRQIPPGATCGSCVSISEFKYLGKIHLKCRMNPITHSAGNDIKKSYGACKQWAPSIRV